MSISAIKKSKDFKDMTDEQKFKILFSYKEYPEQFTRPEVSLIRRVVYKYSQNDYSNFTPFGSNQYVGNIYASDIDIFQIVEKPEQPLALKSIVDNIMYVKRGFLIDFFIADIKCGLNTRYKELKNYIGKYDYKKNKLVDYNPISIKNIFHRWSITEKVYDTPTIQQYLQLKYFVHDLITRRWTYDDILVGYQFEEDGSKYTLYDGCAESELTKIDLYGDGNSFIMTECTNVLMDKKTEETSLKSNSNSVYESMLMCYYVKEDLFKALKRLYALCRKNKKYSLTVKLHKFLQAGDLAILNYCKCLMDIGNYIIQNYYTKFFPQSHEKLDLHYGYILTELQRIYNEKSDFAKKYIDGIDRNIIDIVSDNNFTEENVSKINDFTESFKKKILEITNHESDIFIKENKIKFENFTHLI
jgi:hypothetical protein